MNIESKAKIYYIENADSNILGERMDGLHMNRGERQRMNNIKKAGRIGMDIT